MIGGTAEALLALAAALMGAGLFGIVLRRGIVFQLLGLEIMLAGAALAFVAAGAHHGDPGGQAMFVLILALAAAKTALGLVIFLALRRASGSAASDRQTELSG